MTEKVNPYAVSSPSELVAHPIHFGGTLTRNDLMISLRDSPRPSGWARFQYPIVVIAILVLLGLLQAVGAGPGQSVAGMIWPVLAYPLLPAWLWLIRLVTPTQRRRRRRLEESAKNCTLNRGWMNDDHFVIYDDDMFLRASWTFFGSAFAFDSHLLLPMAADSTHRIVLPYRFFTAPADVKQSLEIVKEKAGLLVKAPPKDPILAQQIESAENPGERHLVEETLGWDSDRWPFDSSDEGQQDFTIDLTAGQKGWRFSLLAMSGVLIFMTWYFLPVWVAVTTWLLSNFFWTGDWSFLLDQIAATAIVVGPAAFILVFFLYTAVAATLQIRRVQTQPFSIRVRRDGVHLSHESFQSWFRWAAVEQVLADGATAGWQVKENKDEVRFPTNCFEAKQYEKFKQTLKRYGPTKD